MKTVVLGSNDSSSRVVSIHLRNTELEEYYNKQSDFTTADTSDPPSTALTGKFPAASLTKLAHLKHLDLAFNNFQELEIPRQFYHLTSLTHLDLSHSNFSTSISTQFTNLSSLRYLDLSCTSEYFFTSCLQTSSTNWMRGLVNLKVLRMSGMRLHLLHRRILVNIYRTSRNLMSSISLIIFLSLKSFVWVVMEIFMSI